MAANPQSKRLSLDTNFLINLADRQRFALDFMEQFQRKDFSLEIVPIVVEELLALSIKGDGLLKSLADIAITNLQTKWGIIPIALSDSQRRSGENFVSIIANRKILPPKEINDARVLAETAISGIQMLITSDNSILDSDELEMDRAFKDAGFTVVKSVHPKGLVRPSRKSWRVN